MKSTCPEDLNDETGRTLVESITPENFSNGDSLILDFSQTKSISSTGGAWLIRLAQSLNKHETEWSIEGATGSVADYLRFIEPGFATQSTPPKTTEKPLESLGGGTISFFQEAKQFIDFSIDTLYWTCIGPFEGKGFRWKLMIEELHEMGYRAIGINFLMNFLLGLIIAMLSAAQLQDFGATIFVADLVVIAFARELAAVMTATVVSARTGAAIAAEIATMQVQEEIDSLRAMGLNVIQYLVAPKVVALLIAMPCLVAMGILSGYLGGSLWGIVAMGIDPSAWLQQMLNAIQLSDLSQGMIKAFIFAVVIVLIGCHNGFRVQGGSRGVGIVTTRAVVMDIFALIVIDVVFAALFYYAL